MGKVKTAKHGDYVISKNEEGAIKVCKDYANDTAALREVAGKLNFQIDPKWNTRQFGAKLIEAITGEHVPTKDSACAEYGEYVIFKTESGSIQVFREYDNTKGALREISDAIGFKYDDEWNTRQFGSKLIDKING